MGMYTELNCAFQLKGETPVQVIKTIEFMCGVGSPTDPPDHKLFTTTRWSRMLTSDSYYFDGDTNSTIRFDEISKQYRVTIRCNLKNYDNEIELFMEWVTPHIDATKGDFLGYKRYESDDHPTLLYYPNQWCKIK